MGMDTPDRPFLVHDVLHCLWEDAQRGRCPYDLDVLPRPERSWPPPPPTFHTLYLPWERDLALLLLLIRQRGDNVLAWLPGEVRAVPPPYSAYTSLPQLFDEAMGYVFQAAPLPLTDTRLAHQDYLERSFKRVLYRVWVYVCEVDVEADWDDCTRGYLVGGDGRARECAWGCPVSHQEELGDAPCTDPLHTFRVDTKARLFELHEEGREHYIAVGGRERELVELEGTFYVTDMEQGAG